MSQVFGIRDITDGKILYESSTSILKATLALAGEDRAPFFAMHDFNPEGQPTHVVSGYELSKQLCFVLALLEEKPEEFRFCGMNKDHAKEFFEDLESYCRSNAFHRFTCYVFD